MAVWVTEMEPGNEMSPLIKGLLTDSFVDNRQPGAIGGREAQEAQEMREKSVLLGAEARAGGTTSTAPWSGHPPGQSTGEHQTARVERSPRTINSESALAR